MSKVYFMRRADGVGPIKIGCSGVPLKRLATHQAWAPEPLEIVASADGTFADEQALHRQFAKYRLHGEWFEAAPPVLSVLARVAANGELPPRQAYDRNVQIVARFKNGATLQEIADDHGVTRQRIEQILRKEGVARRGHCGRKRAPVWDNIETVRALAAEGCSRREIADAIGDSYQNVITAIKTYDIAVQDRKRSGHSEKVTETAFEVARLYKSGASTLEIANAIGRTQPEIYRFLAIAGVKPNRRSRPCSVDKERLVKAYRNGATLDEVAEQFGCSSQTARRHIVAAGALRSRAESEAIRVARVQAANARRAA